MPVVDLEMRLLEGRWVSEARLEEARQESRQSGHSLWYSLVELRYMSQEEVMMFLACESGVPYVRISDYVVQEELLSLLGQRFCVDNILFPLFRIGGTLFIASSNPFDAAVADAAGRMSGLNCEFLMASVSSIRDIQESYWDLNERMFDAQKFMGKPHRQLRGVGFYRHSERVPVKLPVSVLIDDASFVLSRPSCCIATTTDISKDGNAAGIETSMFLPPKLLLRMEIDLPGGMVNVGAQILNCRMEKGGRYLAGTALSFGSPADKAKLMKVFVI